MNPGLANPPAATWQQGWAQALLSPQGDLPAGLVAPQGASVQRRFAAYRNNVVCSLVDVLGAGFPVLRQALGAECFDAVAREHVFDRPPTSPVMTAYGDDLADWLQGFAPLAAWPWLPGLARLERARVRAQHAADAPAVPASTLQAWLAAPHTLVQRRVRLHPSVQLLGEACAVVSLWAAHQHDDALTLARAVAAVDLNQPEAALVLRDPDDQVLVLPLAAAEQALVRALMDGAVLSEALAAAPAADLAGLLALLIRHGAWCEAADADPVEGDPP